ncbi:MAG: UDP-galactose-lipid carrier transferase [Actinomycetota bacterium]|nr:UDP-galactose-lipid carrier transferase [Actinomycetota bacterium]
MGRLDAVDLTRRLARPESEQRLAALQRRLLHLRLIGAGLIGARLAPPLCVVFEGWDAAGKGGAIKRLVASLDPRHVTVRQYAAPDEEGRRHHFLWRFGPNLPGWGEMSIYDRSWYGRVLVERVEQLASEPQWRRAYGEIVDFERSLAAEQLCLVKFFLHISAPEQLARFERRRDDPLRNWKLTEEDWRNRAKRPEYERAIEEMLERTDHEVAPWHVVAAESKHYARVAVIERVIAAMEASMHRVGIEPPPARGADYDDEA